MNWQNCDIIGMNGVNSEPQMKRIKAEGKHLLILLIITNQWLEMNYKMERVLTVIHN